MNQDAGKKKFKLYFLPWQNDVGQAKQMLYPSWFLKIVRETQIIYLVLSNTRW
jgi:hypothetical protein